MGTVGRDFWEYVQRGAPDECWPWVGGRTPKGYGIFRRPRGEQLGAHRYAWELTRGEDPGDRWVLHTCDNPPCCNPAHLYAGTPKDNARDRDIQGKGRNQWER